MQSNKDLARMRVEDVHNYGNEEEQTLDEYQDIVAQLDKVDKAKPISSNFFSQNKSTKAHQSVIQRPTQDWTKLDKEDFTTPYQRPTSSMIKDPTKAATPFSQNKKQSPHMSVLISKAPPDFRQSQQLSIGSLLKDEFGLSRDSIRESTKLQDKYNTTKNFSSTQGQKLSPRRQEPVVIVEEKDPIDPLKCIADHVKQTCKENQIQEEDSNLLNKENKDKLDFSSNALLSYEEYDDLWEILNQKRSKYAGVTTCTKLRGVYFFAGNEKGYIRVFNTSEQKLVDLKPLFDPQLAQNPVKSIDISLNMDFLVAGYESGTIALFDLQSYKLIKLEEKVHQSEIYEVRIVSTDQNQINTISFDHFGEIYYTEFKTKVNLLQSDRKFGQSKKQELNKHIQSKAQGFLHPLTMAINRCEDDRFIKSIWTERNLVAIGSSTHTIILQMNPYKLVAQIKRPDEIEQNQVPYLDFGYGLTPTNRDRTQQLLAIGWGKTIQICVFKEEGEQVDFYQDGCFTLSSDIRSIHFASDSVLCVIDGGTLKLLYCQKFLPGTLDVNSHLTAEEKEANQMKAYLDDGLTDLNQSLVNLRYYSTFEEETDIQISLYNSFVTKGGKYIFLTRENTITKICCLGPDEYINQLLTGEKSITWQNQLKTCLMIYHGELNGFADMEDQLEDRKEQLFEFMSLNLVAACKRALKFYKKATNESEKQSLLKSFLENSIEFCLIIKEQDLLFDTVYDDLVFENGLGDDFVDTLKQFIMQGQFKVQDYILPQEILVKLVFNHASDERSQELDRLVKQLNWMEYEQLDTLQNLCEQKLLVGSIFHIQMCQNKQTTHFKKCRDVLFTMLKMLQKAQDLEKSRQLKQTRFKTFSVDDLEYLAKIDNVKKQEIEKSSLYIGYYILYTIDNMLAGVNPVPFKHLPEFVDENMYRDQVYAVITFLNEEEPLQELLQFDSENFFRVILNLFQGGEPWKFFGKMKKHIQKLEYEQDQYNEKRIKKGKEPKYREIEIKFVGAGELVEKILEICGKADILLGETKAQRRQNQATDDFYAFILILAYNQSLLNAKHEKRLKEGKQKRLQQLLVINEKLLASTMRNVIQSKFDGRRSKWLPSDENVILGALRIKPLKLEDVQSILLLIESQPDSQSFINVQIELYINNSNYEKAFLCLLQSQSQKKRIFDWIDDYLQKLEPDKQEMLKKAVRFQFLEIIKLEMYELAPQKPEPVSKDKILSFEESKQQQQEQQRLSKMNILERVLDGGYMEIPCKQTLQLMNKYFNTLTEWQNLVESVLSEKADMQLSFLKTFIVEKIKEIEATIVELSEDHNDQKVVEVFELHKRFMVIFTRRLCEKEASNVEDWMKLEIFPIAECIQVCQTMRNYGGQASLQVRLGDGRKAIQLYIEQIKDIEKTRITSQLQHMFKTACTFKVGQFNSFEELGGFDRIFMKAVNIASQIDKNTGRLKFGEDAWFIILEYLNEQKYSLWDPVVSDPNEMRLRQKAFKDFLLQRIKFVCDSDNMSLSFRRMVEHLTLEYDSIQALCRFKLEGMKADAARNINVCQAQDIDLFRLQRENVEAGQYGTYMKVRFNEKRRKFEGANICWLCRSFIINQDSVLPMNSFICGHVYHESCLKNRNTCFVCDSTRVIFDEDEIYEHQHMLKEYEMEEDMETRQQKFDMSLQDKSRIKQTKLAILDDHIYSTFLTTDDFS